jgi:hypothetical protein
MSISGSSSPAAPGGAPPADRPFPASRRPRPRKPLPDNSRVQPGWWLAAAVLVIASALVCVLVARATGHSPAHRAAAAFGALLVLVTLACLAQALLLSYQAQLIRQGSTIAAPSQARAAAQAAHSGGIGAGTGTLIFRLRGLKAAIMGQDGRTSTSKTQVVLWTAAVVWALVDLLLLARAYPGTSVFTSAVTKNWHPEYLVLLGLPVAAATTAKAAVAGSNGGHGPAPAGPPAAALAGNLNLSRVYTRDLEPGAPGLVSGLAELLTGDDGTVAVADLQYVVFTLITLVFFITQVLAAPQGGLPSVPAALLTLMGVSTTAYAANKLVDTKGQAVS